MKTSNTTTELIVNNGVTMPAFVPKPTKTDVINAAVQRAINQAEEHNKQISKAKESIDKKAKALAKTMLIGNKSGMRITNEWFRGNEYICYVEITNPEFVALKHEREALKSITIDEKELKEKLRREMNGGKSTVDKILSNSAAVEAIDTMLNKINNPT